MIARWAGLAAAMCMGGCAATVPQFDVPREGDAPTIRSINREITCELLGIARGAPFDQYIAKSRDVYVAAQITLEVTDDGTLAPSLGYATAPFTFGGGLAFEQSRSQYFHAELKYVLSDVKGAADLSEPDCSQPANTNLARHPLGTDGPRHRHQSYAAPSLAPVSQRGSADGLAAHTTWG